MSDGRRKIEIDEYKTARLGHNEIRESQGISLHKNFENQVDVVPPSAFNDHQWELTASGWVGFIPVDDDIGILLKPKVEIGNLFRMLEYAYDLESFEFLEDITDCSSLQDLYERLANILAQKVVSRGKKGLFRDYLRFEEQLPYLRGRWDVRRSMLRFWEPDVQCKYEEHTADVEDNQILAWTLLVIIRSGICSERVLPTVRKAYRMLRNTVRVSRIPASACINRLYNRLNGDYHPMHILCRFFLEQTGPTHEEGDRSILPFLVNMNALFERFVTRWLQAHLPPDLILRDQERVDIDDEGRIKFRIDLVIMDAKTRVVKYVIDTKYKTPDHPDTSDISQVVSYAEATLCKEAILLYPATLKHPYDREIGRIRVRSLAFSLDKDLDEAGSDLLSMLVREVNIKSD
jgi:5-methylcytosine-specific restriction enzyme subunit McrC